LPQHSSKVSSTKAPDAFGDLIDLIFFEAKRQAAISNCTSAAVGGLHRKQRYAIAAVALKDCSINIMPSGRFNIDVDIGKTGTLGTQESFKEQIVLNWVNTANAK
jgi:hypothetical protein